MPAKMSRSAPRPPFRLREVSIAVRTLRLSCRKAGKAPIFTPVRESSGESRSEDNDYEHEGRLRLLLALHRGIPHDLLNACLIHRELRQMLFSRYVRRRHSGKLLLHFLKHTARLC
jgi:hypothetical protein